LINNETDGCCRIDKDKYFEIGEFAENSSGQKMVVGRKYTKISPFFVEPMNSLTQLGIAFCENLDPEYECFSIDRITAKFFRLPYGTGFVLVPILHWQKD
jgi:hypothetical protein